MSGGPPAHPPEALLRHQGLLESALERYMRQRWRQAAPQADALTQAAAYALLGGGKRLRPALTLECAALFTPEVESALDAAIAVEMVHTYSLIHDDLPCMDDDDLRRGQPSCHKRFGEGLAVLAGDALLTEAFACLASQPMIDRFGDAVARWVALLARAAGAGGMAGGQAVDLALEGADPAKVTLPQLETLHRAKTGALIACACRLGAEIGWLIGGGARGELDSAPALAAVERYGWALGLAFQIADDLLDATGDAPTLGKSAGKDSRSGKSTYVQLLGLAPTRVLATEAQRSAAEAVEPFGERANYLVELARFAVQRDR